MSNEIDKAIENFKKRNNGLKNNPVCQDVLERVNKQNYEIQRNNLAISALIELNHALKEGKLVFYEDSIITGYVENTKGVLHEE